MELLGPVKESVSDSELRSPDPANADPLKASAAATEFDATLPEKSAEGGAEGLALFSPQPLGEYFTTFLNLGGVFFFFCYYEKG